MRQSCRVHTNQLWIKMGEQCSEGMKTGPSHISDLDSC